MRLAKIGHDAEWRRVSVGAEQPAVNSRPTSNSFEANLRSHRGSLAVICTPEKYISAAAARMELRLRAATGMRSAMRPAATAAAAQAMGISVLRAQMKIMALAQSIKIARTDCTTGVEQAIAYVHGPCSTCEKQQDPEVQVNAGCPCKG